MSLKPNTTEVKRNYVIDSLVAHLELRNSKRQKLKRILVHLTLFVKKEDICCNKGSTNIEDCEILK